MLDSPRVVWARGLSLSRTPQAGTSAWISVSDRFPLVATSAWGRGRSFVAHVFCPLVGQSRYGTVLST